MARRSAAFRWFAAPALALLPLMTGGCASLPSGFSPLPAAEAPPFDALRFFEGRSEGRGQLSKVFSGRVPVRVISRGEIGADGTLTLLQQVFEGDEPVRTRVWEIRELEPGRYEGTLSDAVGLVSGEASGNRLTLRFAIKDGFKVEQVLTLSPDGGRAYNVLKVRKLGVTVAVLAEDIVRIE